MTRILIATLCEPGHINPLMGAARWLVADGVHVGWWAVRGGDDEDALRARVRTTGAEAPELSPDDGPPPPPPWVQEIMGSYDKDAMRSGRHELVRAGMQIAGHQMPGLVEWLRDYLAAHEADAALVDPLLWHVGAALELAGIPYIGVCTNLEYALPSELELEIDAWTLAPEHRDAFHERRPRLYQHYGLERDFAAYNPFSPWINTVFSTEECIGAHVRKSPRPRLVGPSAPLPSAQWGDFDPARLDAQRPLIYASYGTQIGWQPERFSTIARIADELGAQLVIAAGSLAAEPGFAESLAGDPIVLERAPQLALLERCQLFVTHGGGNSVMEAHCAGTPMLVDPIDIDQSIQAHFVKCSGAGLWCDVRDSDAARAAVKRLLDDSTFRQRCDVIARSFAGRDGGREIADLVLDLARGKLERSR